VSIPSAAANRVPTPTGRAAPPRYDPAAMTTISTKPPSGMRDFLAPEVARRRHVIGVIQRVYESFGFVPLETPAI
jgi:hypothetical protein